MTSTGKEVCKFSIAVYAGKDRDTNFINCVAFGVSAKMLSERGIKGRKVFLEGSWSSGKYENKQGQTVYTNECMVNRVEFEKEAYQNKETSATGESIADYKRETNNEQMSQQSTVSQSPITGNVVEDVPF